MVILIIIKSYIYYNNYTIYNNNFKYIKMIDQKKINTMIAIKKEFSYINNFPGPNISINVNISNENNIFHWTATMIDLKILHIEMVFLLLKYIF